MIDYIIIFLEYFGKLSNITDLNLECCTQVDEKGLSKLALYCPRLQTLHLKVCMGTFATSYSCLNLKGCYRVNNQAIQPIITKCSFLEELGLERLKEVSDATMLLITANPCVNTLRS